MPGRHTKKDWNYDMRMHDAIQHVAWWLTDAENPKDFWRRAYNGSQLKTENPWNFNFYDVIEAVRLIKKFTESNYKAHDHCKKCPLNLGPDRLMKLPNGLTYGSNCIFDWKDERWEDYGKMQKEGFEDLLGNYDWEDKLIRKNSDQGKQEEGHICI